MANRDSFLSCVRDATVLGRRYRVHLLPVPEETGYLGVGGDLCQHFAAEVNAVGGEAFLVPDRTAAAQQLKQLLAECSARKAVCWQHELLEQMGVGELLAQAGVEALDNRALASEPLDQQREKLLACDVGITSCDLAIAETGTLMMCSGPGHERVASLLPPVHIAIIERRQIVPDLIDAFRVLSGDQTPNPHSQIQNLPSNVTFITGPSKTGDIELQLTTGVHGPGRWHVIVITG